MRPGREGNEYRMRQKLLLWATGPIPTGDIRDVYLPTAFCPRLTAASRGIIPFACPMHKPEPRSGLPILGMGSCQGLRHGQDSCQHGQLSAGEWPTEVLVVFTLA